MNDEMFKELCALFYSNKCELVVDNNSAFLKIHCNKLLTLKFNKEGDKFVPHFTAWLHEK